MENKKLTQEKLITNLVENKGDYNSQISIVALYKKIYGELPAIQLSGQQGEFANILCSVMVLCVWTQLRRRCFWILLVTKIKDCLHQESHARNMG